MHVHTYATFPAYRYCRKNKKEGTHLLVTDPCVVIPSPSLLFDG